MTVVATHYIGFNGGHVDISFNNAFSPHVTNPIPGYVGWDGNRPISILYENGLIECGGSKTTPLTY